MDEAKRDPVSGLVPNDSGIVPGASGGKSMAQRAAQTAGGTGTGGHVGTGREDTTPSPGRVTAGSTGGGGLVGGSAIGDEGIGDTEGGTALGFGGGGGAGGAGGSGEGSGRS